MIRYYEYLPFDHTDWLNLLDFAKTWPQIIYIFFLNLDVTVVLLVLFGTGFRDFIDVSISIFYSMYLPLCT